MGLRLVLCALVALVLAAPANAGPLDRAAAYLRLQQNVDGGFGEPGRASSPSLTAWAVLGLRAAGRAPKRPAAAADYLVDAPEASVTTRALYLLALEALDRGVGLRADGLASLRRKNGQIGATVSSTIWAVIALRAAGRPAGRATMQYLLRHQRGNGGWSGEVGGTTDSNDTAAAVQALRAGGVGANLRPIRRALRYLRLLQNKNGGFEQTPDGGSNAQSTAWAVQAFLSAERRPGPRAFAYLRSLQRRNGSFRYAGRRVATPVRVTAQVLPALAARPFPLR